MEMLEYLHIEKVPVDEPELMAWAFRARAEGHRFGQDMLEFLGDSNQDLPLPLVTAIANRRYVHILT